MLSISVDDLEDSKIMTEFAQGTAPVELIGYLKQYSSLLARLQSDYANTKFIISGVGHEMREGFSSVKNYVATLAHVHFTSSVRCVRAPPETSSGVSVCEKMSTVTSCQREN